MEDFKPKFTSRITSPEKQFLISQGFNWCPCCRRARLIDEFSSIKIKYCRECARAFSESWRSKNKERINARRRKAVKKPRSELSKQKSREYYQKNKEKRRAASRIYYNKIKEDEKEERRVKREEKERTKPERLEARRIRYNARRKEYTKRRMKDPVFLLSKRVRCLIRKSIRLLHIPKTKQSMEMLGCDWEFFKNHIESQFVDGMSWERIKEIHIDHIIPLATATTEEDVIRLSHYTNLRPMWAKDNLSKGARLDY